MPTPVQRFGAHDSENLKTVPYNQHIIPSPFSFKIIKTVRHCQQNYTINYKKRLKS